MVEMSSGPPQGLQLRTERSHTLKPALLFAALVALFAVAFAVGGTRTGEAVTPSANCNLQNYSPGPTLDSCETELLQAINSYRAENGVGPLTTDDRLNASAGWFAEDMATDNYFPFDHMDNEDPPRGPGGRAAAFGFVAPVGENAAAGFSSTEDLMLAWQNSPGHNGNMLNASYTIIGIGRGYNPNAKYGVYWVTDFAYYAPPYTSTPTPTPTPEPTATPQLTPTPSPTLPPQSPPATGIPTETEEPTETSNSAPAWGDTDCDGEVSPIDSIRILRLDAGLLNPTPAGCIPMGGSGAT
jgi:uncharacterized protein YkwD